jgi:tetratricopeptide (TPR) repeat protein
LLLLDFDHNNDNGLEVELIDMDRADEAIRVWQQGLLEGARGAIRIWLGRLLELCGRLGEAEQMWRQALAEGDGEAMSKLAEVLELQGRHAESREMYAADGIGLHIPNRPPE